MSSLIPAYPRFLLILPLSRATLYCNNSSPSTKAMSSSASSLPTSSFHLYLLRSQRHLMPACLQPTPPYLSCWWTEDLTELWSSSLKMNLGPFSAPSSYPSLKQNSRPTMVNRWRLRWQTQRELNQLRGLTDQGQPLLPLQDWLSTHTPNGLSGNPLLPDPSLPIRPLVSTSLSHK